MQAPSPTPNQTLLSAVARGNLSQANKSLGQGADPNAPDEMGQLPVLIAMRQKDRSMLALLLKHDVNLRAVTEDNMYPMALASIMDDTEAIQVMAAHCADFESPIENEPSALEHALIAGRMNAARELIRHGADTECIGTLGEAMVSRMSVMGNENAVRLLFEEGVSALNVDAKGSHVVDYARQSGNENVVRLVHDQAKRQSMPATSHPTSCERASLDFRATIKTFVRNVGLALRARERHKTRATLNLANSLRTADLMTASDILTTQEVHVDTRGADGTPLIVLAVKACQPCSSASETENAKRLSMGQNLIGQMIKRGANPLATDPQTGRNLLHELVHQRQETLALHFLATGLLNSAINRSDKDLNRPLHLVSRSGMANLAMALIQKGADINPVNRLGETPLHLCALHLDLSIAEILVGKGANRNLKTRKGQTIQSLLQTIDSKSNAFSMLLESRRSIESAMSIFSADNPMATLARSGMGLRAPSAKPNPAGD